MQATASWISQHALSLWAALLVVALLLGDAGWRLARRRRLAATGATGYRMLPPRLAAGLLAACGGGFALLFWAVWTQTALRHFDAQLALDLRTRLPAGALHAVALLTQVGNPQVIATAAVLIALLLAWRRRWRQLAPWVLGLLGVAGSGHVIKQFVQRPRPFGGHGFILETGFSFPSGHAAGTLVFFGLLAWLLRTWSPRRHRDMVAAAVALTTLIGMSRVMLQVHYLSDVLAGYLLGACWLVLALLLADWLQQGRRAR